jgi:hypothetical protein
VKVEVFYSDGCPNHRPAVERVNELLQEFRLTGNVCEVPVTDSASAIALRFLGSPTIHINGVDVEPSSRISSQFGLMCRTYRDGPQIEGVPSVELIRRALLEASNGRIAHRIDAQDEPSHPES